MAPRLLAPWGNWRPVLSCPQPPISFPCLPCTHQCPKYGGGLRWQGTGMSVQPWVCAHLVRLWQHLGLAPTLIQVWSGCQEWGEPDRGSRNTPTCGGSRVTFPSPQAFRLRWGSGPTWLATLPRGHLQEWIAGPRHRNVRPGGHPNARWTPRTWPWVALHRTCSWDGETRHPWWNGHSDCTTGQDPQAGHLLPWAPTLFAQVGHQGPGPSFTSDTLSAQPSCFTAGGQLDPVPLWRPPGQWVPGTVHIFPTPSLQRQQVRLVMQGQGLEELRLRAWGWVLPGHTKVGAVPLAALGTRGTGDAGHSGPPTAAPAAYAYTSSLQQARW